MMGPAGLICAGCGGSLGQEATRCAGCGLRVGEDPPPYVPFGSRPIAGAAPRAPRPPERGVGSAALLSCGSIAVWFVSQLVVGVIVGLVWGVSLGASGQQLTDARLQELLVFLVPIVTLGSTAIAVGLAYFARPHVPEKKETASHGRTALAVLGCFLACLGGQALISWLQSRVGVEHSEQEFITTALTGPDWGPKLGLALTIILLAPIGEELVFRRVSYRALTPHLGVAFAALVTGLLFAVIHFNLAGLFLYLWLSTSCVAAYELTGRIGAAMWVHALNNATVFVFTVRWT